MNNNNSKKRGAEAAAGPRRRSGRTRHKASVLSPGKKKKDEENMPDSGDQNGGGAAARAARRSNRKLKSPPPSSRKKQQPPQPQRSNSKNGGIIRSPPRRSRDTSALDYWKTLGKLHRVEDVDFSWAGGEPLGYRDELGRVYFPAMKLRNAGMRKSITLHVGDTIKWGNEQSRISALFQATKSFVGVHNKQKGCELQKRGHPYVELSMNGKPDDKVPQWLLCPSFVVQRVAAKDDGKSPEDVLRELSVAKWDPKFKATWVEFVADVKKRKLELRGRDSGHKAMPVPRTTDASSVDLSEASAYPSSSEDSPVAAKDDRSMSSGSMAPPTHVDIPIDAAAAAAARDDDLYDSDDPPPFEEAPRAPRASEVQSLYVVPSRVHAVDGANAMALNGYVSGIFAAKRTQAATTAAASAPEDDDRKHAAVTTTKEKPRAELGTQEQPAAVATKKKARAEPRIQEQPAVEATKKKPRTEPTTQEQAESPVKPEAQPEPEPAKEPQPAEPAAASDAAASSDSDQTSDQPATATTATASDSSDHPPATEKSAAAASKKETPKEAGADQAKKVVPAEATTEAQVPTAASRKDEDNGSGKRKASEAAGSEENSSAKVARIEKRSDQKKPNTPGVKEAGGTLKADLDRANGDADKEPNNGKTAAVATEVGLTNPQPSFEARNIQAEPTAQARACETPLDVGQTPPEEADGKRNERFDKKSQPKEKEAGGLRAQAESTDDQWGIGDGRRENVSILARDVPEAKATEGKDGRRESVSILSRDVPEAKATEDRIPEEGGLTYKKEAAPEASKEEGTAASKEIEERKQEVCVTPRPTVTLKATSKAAKKAGMTKTKRSKESRSEKKTEYKRLRKLGRKAAPDPPSDDDFASWELAATLPSTGIMKPKSLRPASEAGSIPQPPRHVIRAGVMAAGAAARAKVVDGAATENKDQDSSFSKGLEARTPVASIAGSAKPLDIAPSNFGLSKGSTPIDIGTHAQAPLRTEPCLPSFGRALSGKPVVSTCGEFVSRSPGKEASTRVKAASPALTDPRTATRREKVAHQACRDLAKDSLTVLDTAKRPSMSEKPVAAIRMIQNSSTKIPAAADHGAADATGSDARTDTDKHTGLDTCTRAAKASAALGSERDAATRSSVDTLAAAAIASACRKASAGLTLAQGTAGSTAGVHRVRSETKGRNAGSRKSHASAKVVPVVEPDTLLGSTGSTESSTAKKGRKKASMKSGNAMNVASRASRPLSLNVIEPDPASPRAPVKRSKGSKVKASKGKAAKAVRKKPLRNAGDAEVNADITSEQEADSKTAATNSLTQRIPRKSSKSAGASAGLLRLGSSQLHGESSAASGSVIAAVRMPTGRVEVAGREVCVKPVPSTAGGSATSGSAQGEEGAAAQKSGHVFASQVDVSTVLVAARGGDRPIAEGQEITKATEQQNYMVASKGSVVREDTSRVEQTRRLLSPPDSLRETIATPRVAGIDNEAIQNSSSEDTCYYSANADLTESKPDTSESLPSTVTMGKANTSSPGEASQETNTALRSTSLALSARSQAMKRPQLEKTDVLGSDQPSSSVARLPSAAETCDVETGVTNNDVNTAATKKRKRLRVQVEMNTFDDTKRKVPARKKMAKGDPRLKMPARKKQMKKDPTLVSDPPVDRSQSESSLSTFYWKTLGNLRRRETVQMSWEGGCIGFRENLGRAYFASMRLSNDQLKEATYRIGDRIMMMNDEYKIVSLFQATKSWEGKWGEAGQLQNMELQKRGHPYMELARNGRKDNQVPVWLLEPRLVMSKVTTSRQQNQAQAYSVIEECSVNHWPDMFKARWVEYVANAYKNVNKRAQRANRLRGARARCPIVKPCVDSDDESSAAPPARGQGLEAGEKPAVRINDIEVPTAISPQECDSDTDTITTDGGEHN